ncbi:MAG: hypothetical protein R6X32_06145 [Chloroflexota bacterium]
MVARIEGNYGIEVENLEVGPGAAREGKRRIYMKNDELYQVDDQNHETAIGVMQIAGWLNVNGASTTMTIKRNNTGVTPSIANTSNLQMRILLESTPLSTIWWHVENLYNTGTDELLLPATEQGTFGAQNGVAIILKKAADGLDAVFPAGGYKMPFTIFIDPT